MKPHFFALPFTPCDNDGPSMTIEQECPDNQEIFRRFIHGLPLGVNSRPWGKAESFEEAKPIVCDLTDLEKASRFIKSVSNQVKDLNERFEKAKAEKAKADAIETAQLKEKLKNLETPA